MNKIVFNRVQGLKFLYENFPNFYRKDRIQMHFVGSKKELKNLKIEDSFDVLLLKRSSNRGFVSDLKFKDNRFFENFENLKLGVEEFKDEFDFCVECHKFKQNENYYTDRLAIAQFSTKILTDACDRISFIPSKVEGVNTRENKSYLEVVFNYNFGNIYNIKTYDKPSILKNGFNDYDISILIKDIHYMIEKLRTYLIELGYFNDFQLIIRIDKYLNLLPIDFRTPNAWANMGV